jgi:thioredoxin reductase
MRKKMEKRYDVIVVGGSFAGQAAALQIARARRSVLVIDGKSPRNRFAATSHGFLGQDGHSPAAIMDIARQQLLAYPTARFLEAHVSAARGQHDAFQLELKSGEILESKRLVLATGVKDQFPEVKGLAERWGKSVLHCPYCHGYEVAGQQLGVLAVGPLSFHQAMLIPDWGPTTFFTNGPLELEPAQWDALQQRQVKVERCPVVELKGEGTQLSSVLLSDGREIPMDALFTGTKVQMASPLAEQLGCEFSDGLLGPILTVDERQQTTVPGVYAAGDSTRLQHVATLAAASGVMAGVFAHQSLNFDT